MILRIILALVFLVSLDFHLVGQSDWTTIFYPDQDAYGKCITNPYDPGILVAGKHGSNYVSFNWLIKTDVNGSILWNKTIGHQASNIQISTISYNKSGELFLGGLTGFYNNEDYDPLVMKLNSCGEKEWCKVFFAEGNNFITTLEITEDEGCVVLIRQLNPDITKDRLSLAKFSSNGEMEWLESYNSLDSNVTNEAGYDLTLCPDNGFLITGYCTYRDINPPHSYWLKPYYLKTDSLGVFEWDMVINPDTNLPGGQAWRTKINPDTTCFYSALSRLHENGDSPGLAKISFSGDVIGMYDMAPPNHYGKHFELVFLNDSTLAGSAIWGNQSTGVPKAIIFDTLGNIIKSSYLIDNNYMSYVRKTYDGKLLFFTNDQDEQTYEFDAYLFKLDQELNDDTIYNYPFQYDTLCPYSILSDTITQEGCDIIVGIHDYYEPVTEEDLMEIYPNPARHFMNIRYTIHDIRYSKPGASNSIFIYDMIGRLMEEIIVPSGQDEGQLDISHYPDGIYVAVLRDEGIVLGSKKFVVQH